jgi:hypothetical protein
VSLRIRLEGGAHQNNFYSHVLKKISVLLATLNIFNRLFEAPDQKSVTRRRVSENSGALFIAMHIRSIKLRWIRTLLFLEQFIPSIWYLKTYSEGEKHGPNLGWRD